VHVAQAVRLHHVDLLVLALTEVGVDHHGAVVARVHQLFRVPVGHHGADDAVELPWRGRRRRVEEVPADVDLEGGVGVFRDDVLVAREVHHAVVVGEDRARARAEDGDFGLGHGDGFSRTLR
jgi:hypothetical protein